MTQWIYEFGDGAAEGSARMRELLGGKGANLAEMSNRGLPVPPGFTITTEVCKEYNKNGGRYPRGVEEQIDAALARLEALQSRKFGERSDPLLLSVRSGGPVSMPGMMDTVLNLGLNHENVEGMIGHGFDERFVRDCYRRLVSMYGDVVLGVDRDGFERLLAQAREREGVKVDSEISAAGLAALVERYLEYIREEGKEFPQDSRAQLAGSVLAVVESWNNKRAFEYRRIYGLPEDSGTGVNVQAMVFGNRGRDCATGVAFSRDPASGERRLYGEYLINAQGEDVVAGIRTPIAILGADGTSNLGRDFPEAFAELERICTVLEDHRSEMQDVEFTIESGKLYMLQTRHGKRTGLSAVRIAHEMVVEGRIDEREALRRVEGEQLAFVVPLQVIDEEARIARCKCTDCERLSVQRLESELEPFLRREVEDEAQGPGCAATTQSDRHLIRAVPPLPCDELIGEEKVVLDVQGGRRSVQGGAGFNAPISN